MNGTFAYGCPGLEGCTKGEEKLFPKIVSILNSGFSFKKCMFSMPQSRLTASRCVARIEMGIQHSFCIESSFAGITNGRLPIVLYDESGWKEVGASIAEGIYHLLTLENSRIRNLAERELKVAPIKALNTLAPLPAADEEAPKTLGSSMMIPRPNLLIPRSVHAQSLGPSSRGFFPQAVSRLISPQLSLV
jgi:hypothetical protein